jgi:hypothetical protein
MNETGLRWKGRIGSLKIVGFFVGIVACIILAAGASTLNLALKNPDPEPQKVTISQLVNGEIDSGRYVSISGIAEYDVGYTETENGKTTRNFYFLVDPKSGNMILIEHHSPHIVDLDPGNSTTIAGMTRSAPSDLRSTIEDDVDSYREYDLETSTTLYVKDGASPPTTASGVTSLCVSVPLLLLGVVPFFFPTTAFGPYPVDTTVPPPAGRLNVRATGKFQKLKQLEPSIEVGKGSQKLTNSVANVVPLARGRLMIYVHRVVRSRYSTTVSDWGIFLDTDNVHAVEPGKVYSWKDRWAVRFQYQGPKDKPQTLFVIFEQPGDQAAFVDLVRKSGFVIETGTEMM